MAEEAFDVRELVAALNDDDDDDAKLTTINDLPKEMLVSIFMAVGDLRWVRRTVPLVCKEWNEIYCSKDASPLHEALEVDFVDDVARERGLYCSRSDPSAEARRRLDVYRSRVISWAKRRAGSVRKLSFVGTHRYISEDFSAEDLGVLVTAVRSSLTDISLLYCHGKTCRGPFWESLRDTVVPAGRLRSLDLRCAFSESFASDLEKVLGQLAGSLEELVVAEQADLPVGLPRFPESLFALTKLRRLRLSGHTRITAIPAGISSLKKLEDLDLWKCRLPTLPKELGDLSRLTRLDLTFNRDPGLTLRAGESFPAELGKLKSLREIDLTYFGLSTIPALVGELESLESLTLHGNHLSSLPKELGELQGLTKLDLTRNEGLGNTLPADEAFPAELGKMKSLRELNFSECRLRTVPAFVCKLKSLESLDLSKCHLSSLPKELGELSGLTKLDLTYNWDLGKTAQDEALAAALGKLKSLRHLVLKECGLRTVPAFLGGLESLEVLDLDNNHSLQIDAPLDFLIEGCPGLRKVSVLPLFHYDRLPPQSLAHLEAFEAKLRAKNPYAVVRFRK